MKAKSALINRLLMMLAGIVLLAGSLASQTRYLLGTRSSSDLARLTSQYGLTVLRAVGESEDHVYVVTVPAEVLGALQSDPAVRWVRPDVTVRTVEQEPAPRPAPALDPLSDALTLPNPVQYFGAPVREGYVEQNAAMLIHLPQALQQFPAGNSIVAVIDTGVDPTHPALAAVLVAGYDFIRDVPGIPSEWADVDQSTVAILDQSTVAILDQKNWPLVLSQSTVAILDQSTVAILDAAKLPAAFGHGTMVSGLIHLAAPTARIMPLKAFRSDGTANVSDVARAIYYAVDHNARVINMSFSLTDPDPVLMDAVAYAISHRVICIASAGNEGKHLMVYPAGFPGVYGVGSTNKHDRRSPFSNYGVSSVRFAAPGEALVTTYPGNNYAAVWGTSFSAALVSGTSALIANFIPNVKPGYLSDAFEHGPEVEQGMGDSRLDVLAILSYCARKGRD
jgi:subtilisin family serine protease